MINTPFQIHHLYWFCSFHCFYIYYIIVIPLVIYTKIGKPPLVLSVFQYDVTASPLSRCISALPDSEIELLIKEMKIENEKKKAETDLSESIYNCDFHILKIYSVRGVHLITERRNVIDQMENC